MARSDVPFIHSEVLEPQLRVIESNGSDKGLDDRILDEEFKLMNPLAMWSLLREILENSCLRLGRRNKEETTRLHF